MLETCPMSFWTEIGWKKRTESGELSQKFLNQEDVEKLMGATKNVRDKAFVALFWDTGARLSEIYDLKIGDFREWDYGKKVVINGISGQRRLPLITSVPTLENWISKHPQNNNPEAPVWCWTGKEKGKTGEKITYNYIRQMINSVSEKTKIDKLVDLSHFRRSRIAFLGKWFDKNEMDEWFGWIGEQNLEGLINGCSNCAGCPFSCGMSGRL